MIRAVPEEIPVAKPDIVSMVAIVVLLLCHVPPAIPSTNKIVDPIHTDKGPVIAVGPGVTDMVVAT